jgi:hypothetical protein
MRIGGQSPKPGVALLAAGALICTLAARPRQHHRSFWPSSAIKPERFPACVGGLGSKMIAGGHAHVSHAETN